MGVIHHSRTMQGHLQTVDSHVDTSGARAKRRGRMLTSSKASKNLSERVEWTEMNESNRGMLVRSPRLGVARCCEGVAMRTGSIPTAMDWICASRSLNSLFCTCVCVCVCVCAEALMTPHSLA